jgi:hypothetical protein
MNTFNDLLTKDFADIPDNSLPILTLSEYIYFRVGSYENRYIIGGDS